MNYFALTIAIFLSCSATFAQAKEADAKRRSVVHAARHILDHYSITYIYGGGSLGSRDECEQCSQCLEQKKPAKGRQMHACPSCSRCALDCSHFTHWVMKRAGLPSVYIPTQQMLALPAKTLMERYHLADLGTNVALSKPGDLLVYQGHVVMLEKRLSPVFGDIIHATSGLLKEPGQGVQRRRRVNLLEFRGPLQRILRHVELNEQRRPHFRPITRRTNDSMTR